MTEEIVNKVTQSGLLTIDLEALYPEGKRLELAMDDFLYEGLILKEKDFREKLKNTDWAQYKGTFVAIKPAKEAIVPTWAYMLLSNKLQPFANKIAFGDLHALEAAIFQDVLKELELEQYRGQKLVIKGCSDKPVPAAAYVELTRLLTPLAQSIMYGEPCSAVPIYKRKEV